MKTYFELIVETAHVLIAADEPASVTVDSSYLKSIVARAARLVDLCDEHATGANLKGNMMVAREGATGSHLKPSKEDE